MYTDFKLLPDTARIWVYLSDQTFSTEQAAELQEKLLHFCSHWKHHGEDLKSSFLMKYNRFIILAVDESYHEISGCAINKSIKLVQDFEQKFGLELMNRLNIAYSTENELNVVDLQTFKMFAENKKIDSNTLVYNNLVTTKAAFDKEWEVPASQSWHARYLN